MYTETLTDEQDDEKAVQTQTQSKASQQELDREQTVEAAHVSWLTHTSAVFLC